MNKRDIAKSLKVYNQTHDGPGNNASVYGHHGSVRACIRLCGTDIWVYGPEWEQRRVEMKAGF